MQREVLFRGKRADNSEWVEGFYVNKSPEKHQIVTKKDMFPVQVLPKTVGQYTGLTDKNGYKIFEGDIVNLGRERLYFVKYLSCSFFLYHCLELKDLDGKPLTWGLLSRAGELGWQIQVIGNIHDNPELIK